MNNLFLLVLAATLSITLAQDNPPSPKPPLVAAAPTGSQWGLDIKRPADEVKHSEPTKISERKVVPVRFEMRIGKNAVQQGTIKFSDGTVQSFYVVENKVLQKHDNADDIAVLAPQDGASMNLFDFRLKQFPALGWLTLRSYVGIETVEKQECYKYQISNPTDFELPKDCALVAWIRTKDGFPLRVQIGDILYEFSEVAAFPQDVTLPAPYQAVVDNLHGEQRRLKALKSANKY